MGMSAKQQPHRKLIPGVVELLCWVSDPAPWA